MTHDAIAHRNTMQMRFAPIQVSRNEWLARAEPEPVLDPGLPIVDPHLHLWDPPGGTRYFLEDYTRNLVACGHNVEASVYVECFHMYRADGPEHLKSVGETEFAVGQAAMAASGRYTQSRVATAIVGHAELTLGDRTRELLEAQVKAASGRLRGVRQLAKWDADPQVRGKHGPGRPHLYLDPEFGRGLDMATSMGLSFDASVFHPQIPEVASLARAHPDANIILIHTGSPVGHGAYAGREADNRSAWLAGMKELAQCRNVSVKMGGILMTLGNFDFTRADAPPTSIQLADLWRPYIEPCIELFGASRCMVSSNFPVDRAGFGYGTVWNMFKHITAGCSADEKHQLFSGTAKRVYRID